MDKNGLIIIFSIILLLSLNICVAKEMDNSTEVNIDETLSLDESSDIVALTDEIDDQSLTAGNSQVNSKIEVMSNTTFDVVGDYFKVKLLDNDNKSISNAKITFSVNGVTYKETTNNNGIASLQIRLKDGSYTLTTKFLGDSKYKSSSKSTTIVVNNTRIVEEGLSGNEIQKIIDNAKTNNIILFKGTYYENVNLVINKRLTLLSKSNTVLKSNSKNPVILISGKSSSQTTVNGFNIQGNGNGIEIKDTSHVTVINNDIKTKSNGVVAVNANYLNITKNNIVGNSNNGIILALVNNSHIYNNQINKNGLDGIQLAKTNKIYIYDNTISNNGANGIYTSNKVNGVDYKEGPQNLYISKNTINSNTNNGIYLYRAGDNINIKGNTIHKNTQYGISITKIGDNAIQSNVISESYVGIKFNDEYLKPKNQEISYNAIYKNRHVEVEAKDTYYYDFGEPLKIGDNWYTDDKLLCPKVSSNNLKFSVKQVGENLFQATFYDSKGNVATLLPDRTLTYQTNDGQIMTITINGGTGIFTVDNANNGDIIKATVDDSHRDNTYDSDSKTENHPTNGITPSYTYPSIEYESLYDDSGTGGGEGNGDGDGTGDGSGGNAHNGNGTSSQKGSEFTGNSTSSQNIDPANGQTSQVNDVLQSYETQTTTSPASASQSSSGESVDNGGNQQKSVVKQIIIDEDDIVKITGISFIILIMILTIGLYYREDIKEMKSKM